MKALTSEQIEYFLKYVTSDEMDKIMRKLLSGKSAFFDDKQYKLTSVGRNPK